MSSARSDKILAFPHPGPLSADEMLAMTKKLRRHIVSMTAKAGSGHPGGSLSAVEIMTVLYFGILRHNPLDPSWQGRDRLILSKGHAAPALYATLAECGYFPVAELMTLRQLDSRLQGHTDKLLTPGVEMTAGALGQGLSFAVGVALAGKLNAQSYRVYALLGDGECDEGQVWEAAMAASHFKIDNLTTIVDKNELQLDGWTKDIMDHTPLNKKWESFGWWVKEVNGHSIPELIDAFNMAKTIKGQPAVIIAHTIKGKGVSFMENSVDFHGRAPNAAELEKALKELE